MPTPIPEFKGFAIRKYAIYMDTPEYRFPPDQGDYVTESIPLDYDDANWTYRFFLKVRNEGKWAPIMFAICYRGATREEDTPIMALVAPGSNDKSEVKLSSEFDRDPKRYMEDYRHPMQHNYPEKSHYYYGFLQFDYHHAATWYKKGLFTIEIKLGTGDAKFAVDQWHDIQKYQWKITEYIPPG